MKISAGDFRVPPRERVKLDQWPTRVKPVYKSKEEYNKLLAKHTAELNEQQERQHEEGIVHVIDPTPTATR